MLQKILFIKKQYNLLYQTKNNIYIYKIYNKINNYKPMASNHELYIIKNYFAF